MSKKINVNPDHYKTAGRERQGEEVVHAANKQQMGKSRRKKGEGSPNFIPGAAPVGERKAGKGK